MVAALGDRVRDDFQFAVILLCGGVAVVAILPFMLFRLVLGQFDVAAIHASVLLTILAANIYAWRSGNSSGAGSVMSGVVTVGLVMMGAHIAHAAALWSYTLLALNFFMVERRWALVLNGVLIIGLLVQDVFETTYEATTYTVTALLLTTFSLIVAARIQLQRKQLEALALHDTLTGAGNRRLMDIDLRHALARFAAGHATYGIALLDIDHFKRINDRFGHEQGDAVLGQLTEVVRNCTRKFDRFYRFGGEEFVLLVPVPDAQGLGQVLGKVHQSVRQQLRAGGEQVTVSIGAAMARPGEGPESWLARADAALYKAKNAGRDRLVLDQHEETSLSATDRRKLDQGESSASP